MSKSRSNQRPSLGCIPVALIAFMLVGGISVGLLLMNARSSASGVLPSGLKVSVSSDSLYLVAQFETNGATIKTSGMEIKVNSEGVSVDSTLIYSIPDGTKEIQVDVKGGKITVTRPEVPSPIGRGRDQMTE